MNITELGATMNERGPDSFFDQRLNLISRIETMGKPSDAARRHQVNTHERITRHVRRQSALREHDSINPSAA